MRHVSEFGLSHATDREILEAARNDTRTIVTLDADFHTMLTLDGVSSPSVIRIRREGLKGRQLAELVGVVWPKIEKNILKGAMITVTENSVRIHNLPVFREDWQHEGQALDKEHPQLPQTPSGADLG